MEYKKLADLDNTYPSIQKYTHGTTDGSIVLYGIDPTNQIVFNIPDYKTVTPISNTNFRFILSISKDSSDINPKLFTSQLYYNDLEDSFNTHNPYFLMDSFKYMVKFYYSDISDFVKNLTGLVTTQQINETSEYVNMQLNLFINSNMSINYEKLVRYVDWCINTSTLDSLNTGGILPAELLGNWSVVLPTSPYSVSTPPSKSDQNISITGLV